MSFGGYNDTLLMSVHLGMEVLGPGVRVRLVLACINGLLSGCSNLHTVSSVRRFQPLHTLPNT